MKNHTKRWIGMLLVLAIVSPTIGATIYSEDFNSLTPGNLAGQDGWATVSGSKDIVVEPSTQNWGGVSFVQAAGINDSGSGYSAAVRSLGTTYNTGVLTVIFDVKDAKEGSIALGNGTDWARIEQGALTSTHVMMLGQVWDPTNRVDSGAGGNRFKLVVDFDNLTIDGWYEGNAANVNNGIFTNAFNQNAITAGFSVDQIKITQRHGFGDVGAVDNITIDYVPEPATIALLSLGGLACLLRKRKN